MQDEIPERHFSPTKPQQPDLGTNLLGCFGAFLGFLGVWLIVMVLGTVAAKLFGWPVTTTLRWTIMIILVPLAVLGTASRIAAQRPLWDILVFMLFGFALGAALYYACGCKLLSQL